MKVEINGVDVTNDCVVKEDTIIFYGTRWFDGFKLPVESPSPTASSDKPVVGKSKEEILKKYTNSTILPTAKWLHDAMDEYADQALPVKSDVVESDIVKKIDKEMDGLKRNAEKINQFTWETYKEQVMLHIEELDFLLSKL